MIFACFFKWKREKKKTTVLLWAEAPFKNDPVTEDKRLLQRHLWRCRFVPDRVDDLIWSELRLLRKKKKNCTFQLSFWSLRSLRAQRATPPTPVLSCISTTSPHAEKMSPTSRRWITQKRKKVLSFFPRRHSRHPEAAVQGLAVVAVAAVTDWDKCVK